MSFGYALERPTIANMTSVKWSLLDTLDEVSPVMMTIYALARKADMSKSTARDLIRYFGHFHVVMGVDGPPRRFGMTDSGRLIYQRLLAVSEPYRRGLVEWQRHLPPLPEGTIAHRVLALFLDGGTLGSREMAIQLGMHSSVLLGAARRLHADGWLSGHLDGVDECDTARWLFSLHPEMAMQTKEYMGWWRRMTEETRVAERVAG